jgi:hypothetical protein
MWAGQSASLSTCVSVPAFLQALIDDVSAIAGPVAAWSAAHRRRRA